MVWVCIQSLSQLQYDFNQREANSTIKHINVLNIKNNLYFTKHTEKIKSHKVGHSWQPRLLSQDNGQVVTNLKHKSTINLCCQKKIHSLQPILFLYGTLIILPSGKPGQSSSREYINIQNKNKEHIALLSLCQLWRKKTFCSRELCYVFPQQQQISFGVRRCRTLQLIIRLGESSVLGATEKIGLWRQSSMCSDTLVSRRCRRTSGVMFRF